MADPESTTARLNWFPGPEHEPFVFPAGPTGALLIHGFMGTPKEMRPLGRALAGAGVSARGILLPGFGADFTRLSETRRADWLRAAGEAWDEVVERHRAAVLVGFSTGGAVALHLAAQRAPARLILLAPLSRLAGWQVRLLPLLKHVRRSHRIFAGADFEDPALRAFVASALPELDLDKPDVQARLRQEPRFATAVYDELRRLGLEAREVAPRVTAPTLLVQGTADQVLRPADARRLAAQLGGPVTFREVPADHLLVADDHPSWPQVRDLVVGFAAGAESGT